MFKLFRFLKPYAGTITVIIALFLLQALVDLSLPTFMAEIVNKGIVKGDISFILKTGGIMLGLSLGGILCAFAAGFLSSRTSMGFSRRLRSMIFSKIENFSLYEFDSIGGSSLITRTTSDVVMIQQTMVIMLSMMLRAPLMCVGGIILAVSRDPQMSLVLAVAVPLLFVIIFSVQQHMIPLFKTIQAKLDALNLVIREKLSGNREVRAFDRTGYERKRFDSASSTLMDTSLQMVTLMSVIMPVVMTIMNFTMVAIVWAGGLRVQSGNMQVGDIIAFIQYVSLILFSIMMVSMLFIFIPRAQVSAGRINEVLGLAPGIIDTVAPLSPQSAGFVEFKNVDFKYRGAEQNVLCNVSFKAGPGEVTAIVGSTGSGKSTLASLMLRFYDVDSGKVLIDGIDVRDMTQNDLRGRIGYVPQKALLFTGTIADNISFGSKPDAKILENVLMVSQSNDFVGVMRDKDGYVLAQGGKNLSGGQKQRLSIARALYRKPGIYIFDDSFSALDFKTDAALRAALKKETGNSTVIIIAQRVATVMDADRIIVLDEGSTAGIGTHKELLKDCEVYREIVYSQLSQEELA